MEKSAIAEHAWAEQHRPAWDEITILEQARREDLLRIKEAFCIAVADKEKSLNRDRGTATADCWRPLLRRCHRQSAILIPPPVPNSTPDLPPNYWMKLCTICARLWTELCTLTSVLTVTPCACTSKQLLCML